MSHAPSTIPYALVVDDDPIILMNTSNILQDAGYRSYEADTGDDAIPTLTANAESIALLFTDVEMPGELSGFQLERLVDQRWPHIDIVVASGRVKPDDGDMPGKATFISKPFTAQLIYDHLKEKLPDGKKLEPLERAV